MGPDSPLDADVKTAVKTAVEFGANKSCEEAAAAFGSSCALPAAFRVSIHLLSKDLPFEEAIRENIMAGIQHPVCPSRQHKSQRACKCNVPLCRPVSMQWTARADTCDPKSHCLRYISLPGGDQCSRAVFVGACYGAMLGETAVPAAWTQKVSDMPDIDRMAHLLVAPPSKL